MTRSWLMRGLQLAVAFAVGVVVWTIGFGGGGGDSPSPGIDPADVQPGVGEDGDATGVLAVPDVGSVYVIQLSGRPDYRVMRYEGSDGATSTAFAIDELGVVYSLALSPDGTTLALAYTTDYNVEANGLYLLDVSSGETGTSADLVTVADEVPGRFYTHLAFDPDGTTVWATAQDVGGETEGFSVVSIDVDSGAVAELAADAVNPAAGDGWVAYLPLEADGSRRRVAVADRASGQVSAHDVADGRYDLGDLISDPAAGRLLVSALLPEDGSAITIGDPAGAHGSHDGPAQWLTLDPETGAVGGPLAADPSVIWGGTVTDSGLLVVATNDGLSVLGPDGIGPVAVESRRLRDVAG